MQAVFPTMCHHPLEKAIGFVMRFYNVSRKDCLMYYWDEVLAYQNLFDKGIT